MSKDNETQYNGKYGGIVCCISSYIFLSIDVYIETPSTFATRANYFLFHMTCYIF